MAYSQIKKGSKGSSVEELQRLLNQNGYSLAEDGVFGSNTQAAVRDYQRKNGLAVDGIVGTNTWGSLLGGSGGTSSNPTTNSTANWLASYEGNRPSYTPSQAVNDAASILAQYEQNRPGAYQSNYSAQIQGILDQIMNREKFTYDFNADPLYQQHAERYQQQGKLAMMDAMGQAAALTGGYGSSYGQQVGQQRGNQIAAQHPSDICPDCRKIHAPFQFDGINGRAGVPGAQQGELIGAQRQRQRQEEQGPLLQHVPAQPEENALPVFGFRFLIRQGRHLPSGIR